MDNKTILHLNSYYIDNHLYSHLYGKLDKQLSQKVYIPIKLDRTPENEINLPNTELVFDKCITPNHKYNYFAKIRLLYKHIVVKDMYKSVDFSHAHNLFTDGVLAYKLYKEFNIPYIVALRNTDITLQYPLMYHRRPIANKALKNAKKIIFISPTYRDKFFAMLPNRLSEQLLPKTELIPNGINDIWLNNLYPEKELNNKQEIKLIYVGQIMKLKNIKNVVSAVDLLNKENSKLSYSLTIVGGENYNEPDYFKEFLVLEKKHDWLHYKGKIKDPQKLLETYRSCDVFVMPSKPELFGLVYIEALSQGLPIIYSKDEGIDGFFDNPVGVAVIPESIISIKDGIAEVANNKYDNLNKAVTAFDWNKIAQKYINFYQE